MLRDLSYGAYMSRSRRCLAADALHLSAHLHGIDPLLIGSTRELSPPACEREDSSNGHLGRTYSYIGTSMQLYQPNPDM